MDSNDLKRLGLTNVNIFDLFRLDPNGKSSAQLLGFSSSDNQKALKLIRKQYCDIVHLYRARDDDNEAILNSAMAFLEHDTVSRWAELVARPPPDPPDPERCPSPMPASINNHEQDNAVEKSGSLPPNGDMKCPKCNEGPFKTVRRLAGHAMKCPKNSEAPKAKPSSQACVYGCGYVKSNYSAHEAFDHYRCTCGRVVTAKHKDCTGKKTKINPAEYFFGLPLGYLAPKPKPEDILDRAFWNLPQGDIDVLVSLDRDAFTSMAFNAISKRRHHSLEPASIKTTGDAAESTANSCGTSVDQNILDMPSYPASQNGKSRDIRRSPQYCPRGGLNASKGSVDAKPITERFRNAGTRCQPTTQNSPPRISDPEVEVRSAVSVHQPNLFPQAYFDDVTLDLYNYFVNKYCGTRTLYRDPSRNSYLQLLSIHASQMDKGLVSAICCLTSLYMPNASNTLDLIYFGDTIKYLKTAIENPISKDSAAIFISVIRLILQYHTVKRELDNKWFFHIRGLCHIQSVLQEEETARKLSLPITYESIVKVTQRTKEPQKANDGISIDYLLALENPDEIRDIGCSPRLLHLLGCINIEIAQPSSQTPRRGRLLLENCNAITQTTVEPDAERHKGIEKTAESYVHMARVLIIWRLLASDSSPVELHEAGDKLGRCVLGIPVHGELFTAQFPLASAFWAMIFSPRFGKNCYDLMASQWTDKPSNIKRALRIAEFIREKAQGGEVDVDLLDMALREYKIDALSLA